jgi:hypothetical protein
MYDDEPRNMKELLAHSANTHRNCKLTRRSHFAYTTFLNNGLVSWKSKLQSIVTLSSSESEYVALCDLTSEVRYLRQLAKGLGFEEKEPTLCFEDNKTMIMTDETCRDTPGFLRFA